MSALPLPPDALLAELTGGKLAGKASDAPTMGRLKRASYTHIAMIELIIQNPGMTQGELAAHFGYTEGWISNILASDAFQAQMARRREEVIDPVLKASIEERFRSLVIRSLEILHKKLDGPQVSDNVALRAAELGAKALGIGGHAPPPPAPAQDRLAKLAERLIALRAPVPQPQLEKAIDGQVLEVSVSQANPGEQAGVPA